MSKLPEARIVKIGPAPERVEDSIDDKFKPVHADELTDLALLPGQFRSFAAEVRLGFDLLNQRLLPLLERLEVKLDDLAIRVSRVEREQDRAASEHRRLSERVDALESTKRPKRRK